MKPVERANTRMQYHRRQRITEMLISFRPLPSVLIRLTSSPGVPFTSAYRHYSYHPQWWV
jgi:hypothetical protein